MMMVNEWLKQMNDNGKEMTIVKEWQWCYNHKGITIVQEWWW